MALGFGGGGLFDQFLPAGADAGLHAGGGGLCAVVGVGDRADRGDRLCRVRAKAGLACGDRDGDDSGRDRCDPSVLESLAALNVRRGFLSIYGKMKRWFSPRRAGV